MKAKGFSLLEVLIVIAIISILVALIYGTIVENRQWREFSAAHNCKVVQKMQAETHTGVGYASGSGNNSGGPVFVTSTTPGKTAWLCDDGVTYWRND